MTADTFIWLIVFIVIGVLITAAVVQNARGLVREELKRRGLKEITIVYSPLAGSRSSQVFYVEYEDAQAARHTAICNVNIWFSKIDWEDQPN